MYRLVSISRLAVLMLAILSLLLFDKPLANAASDLVIGNYQLVSKTRVSRTEYEYTFKPVITNSGSKAALNTSAMVKSLVSTAIIKNDEIEFGTVPAGASVVGKSAFTIRLNLTTVFDPAKLDWFIFSESPTAAAVIDGSGGIVEVNDSQSRINGAKVEFPAGALNENKEIYITELGTFPLPDGMVTAGPIVDFSPDGSVFNGNVRITIPYYDENNDGIIDYSEEPEGNIKVVTYNSALGIWEYEPIISQDLQNNTVTVEAYHFSPRQAGVDSKPANISSAFIYVIDGLDFVNTGLGASIGLSLESPRTGYLYDAVKKMNLPFTDVYSYSGTPTMSWHGDATKTADLMENLRNDLIAKYVTTKKTPNKKFIIVSHSWGTVLATWALQYEQTVKPDLFITLSTPLGSDNLPREPWYQAILPEIFTAAPVCFKFLPYPGFYSCTVGDVEKKITDFVSKQRAKVKDKFSGIFPQNCIASERMLNYWDETDIISGPLAGRICTTNLQEMKVGGYTNLFGLKTNNSRDFGSMAHMHAITSLSEIKWQDRIVKILTSINPNLQNDGVQLRNRVRQDICAAMGGCDIQLTWTSRVSGTNNGLMAIASSGNKTIVAGMGGVILSSTDGINWNHENSGTAYDFYGGTFANGLFVLVGAAYPGGPSIIITSPDGVSWTERHLNYGSYGLTNVAFGNGVFVTVGNHNVVYTSSDGINWSFSNTESWGNHLNDVKFLNNEFIAVGHNGRVIYSSDGVMWFESFTGTDFQLHGAAFGNGTYITSGQRIDGSAGVMLVSKDLINWTSIDPAAAFIRRISFNGNRFVGAGGNLLVSPDGIHWQTTSNVP